jgi:hypothetical protein
VEMFQTLHRSINQDDQTLTQIRQGYLAKNNESFAHSL